MPASLALPSFAPSRPVGRPAVLRRDMTEDDDGTLMLQVAKGDRRAYGLLVDRHLRHAVNLAYRVLFNRADAEEIAQEAFLRVWQHAIRWRSDGGASFRTWLNRVIVNLCIDRKRKPTMAALDDQPDPVDPAGTPFDAVLGGETSARISAALVKLPERQRAAIVLCYWEGESNIAAAETLGISVGALESLLVRAKRALRDDLDDTLGPAAAAGSDKE